MPQPSLRRSGNAATVLASIWEFRDEFARAWAHSRDALCALLQIEDEYGWRDGDQRKGCHVCWEAHKK
jgi:hypothetical protein